MVRMTLDLPNATKKSKRERVLVDSSQCLGSRVLGNLKSKLTGTLFPRTLNQVCEIHIRLQLDQMAATPGLEKLSANGELKSKISETKDLG